MRFAAALFAVQAGGADDGNRGHKGGGDAVFVQTNKLTGNRIVAFSRGRDGRLEREDSYATGGNGGAALAGTESDRIASQGSLVYDEEHDVLLAVNAGSDSVSLFEVRGNRLKLRDVVDSGGEFPASIAIDDRLVYVLNAGGTGIVQGFWLGR